MSYHLATAIPSISRAGEANRRVISRFLRHNDLLFAQVGDKALFFREE